VNYFRLQPHFSHDDALDSKALSQFIIIIFCSRQQKDTDLQELLAKPDIMEIIQLPYPLKKYGIKMVFISGSSQFLSLNVHLPQNYS